MTDTPVTVTFIEDNEELHLKIKLLIVALSSAILHKSIFI